MTWTLQRKILPKGSSYTAFFTPPKGQRRCVTVGLIAGAPAPADLTARLRAHDSEGRWPDGYVIDACKAVDEAELAAFLRAHRHFDGPQPVTGKAIVEPVIAPLHPNGAMRLRDYVADVWEPVRATQPATWSRETWWWVERILPVLGDERLCNLTTKKWSAFLAKLDCGGRSKGLAQTAYRCAIRHAAETLVWIEGPHRFEAITGATKRTLAEPEPLSVDEVATFLDAVHLPVHRALFGLQIGQGMRPSEVIAVRWEHLDWTKGTITVQGTKNVLAKATVPLTPLSRAEMAAWWKACGKPKFGIAFEKLGGGPFPSYPKQAFKTASKNSGLNDSRERDLFPYLCRHSFATMAAVSGIDRAFTKRMMRHSQKSTVLEDAYERVSVAETASAFAGFGTKKKG